MPKVREVFGPGSIHHGWMIRCPNEECYAHVFDARWTFNGDMEKPTFRNSMLSKCTMGPENRPLLCHSYVTNGSIEFLSDCTHALAGKTVPLQEWPTE